MRLLIFFALLTLSKPVEEPLPSAFVVWSVGQGSWSTLLWKNECWHFDMGGEFYPRRVHELCQNRTNRLYLSHDDWDHISFISKVKKWPRFCLANLPRRFSTKSREKLLQNLEICHDNDLVREIGFLPTSRQSNDMSRIYWIPLFKILIPGDSPKKQEKIWSKNLKGSFSWWLLGHHGSLTSSSNELIEKMQGLRGAIVSARSRRYGHPHPEVVGRLRAAGLPVLKTEDWGHLWIEIKN